MGFKSVHGVKVSKAEVEAKRQKDAMSFTKRIVNRLIWNSIIWVYLSYILAFLGKHDIAENLSINIVNVIIATVITNSTKALFENIFKHNQFTFVTPKVHPILADNKSNEDDTDVTEPDDEENNDEDIDDSSAAG